MMYYVLREERRVVEGCTETGTYDPRNAMMKCDDLVAAEKYFRFCVNQKNIRCILAAESLFDPAVNPTLRDIFRQNNSGGSGFEVLATSINHPNVVGKLVVSEQKSHYMVENASNEDQIQIAKMSKIDLYTIYENCRSCLKIVAEVKASYRADGTRRKVTKDVKCPRVSMSPFTVTYHR